MSKIVRDTEIELVAPPAFDYGQKVRARCLIRNDGTFRGKEIGAVLVRSGDTGYVNSIGTFLQQFYIYGIDFPDRGYCVGMRAKELECAEDPASAPIVERAEFTT